MSVLTIFHRLPSIDINELIYERSQEQVINAAFYLSAICLLVFAAISAILLLKRGRAGFCFFLFLVSTTAYCGLYHYLFVAFPLAKAISI